MMFKRNGYTLIELMVVIVIIGILATLGLVTYQNALKRTRDTKRTGDMKDISAAEEQYKALVGSYVSVGGPPNCIATGTAIGQYSFPSDPSSLTYTCNGNTSAFCVAAQLERGGGNCGGCSGAGTITSGSSHYCVISKQ
ncbi:MAG: hypothetical protein COY81_05205 [Candidatus Pacebacteria bacterium CG_4_10_14_0_8_um_filter_43_12]|nr:MAG: hypothetical protein COU66_02050 [Candidatus Pacebacteria bacterium CG10_big_fil_rev_8_21_14_0_10_44_11]PIY78949.1 MAG: hypothetical protein COY81_05205 [Candidatus Pacebacteria bacterium CG_4_10_14_0_8_um_filter_43_12]